MVEVNLPEVTIQDLYAWFEMKEKLKKLQASEMALRKRVANHYFPTPKEGTNTVKLPDGSELKMVHGMNRKVDSAMFINLLEQFHTAGIDYNQCIENKPTLKVGEYKKLTDHQKSVFDQCIEMTIGSPQLSINVK